ncbi:type II secretion system protein [Deinococcus sp. Marseille-Q6407]|uniref:type II secretion system protein n=1 Tax=Deinococcus sp. Marseille-Q6407 TaxID=2969223 RepID=UPI0021C0B71C|nr:prepilin-type N-terminal cleavage/methylation domain-containing protein [Deinococcus sp. Marseille-Q6407]
MKHSQQGFTLVELLIVLSITAVLLAVLLPNLFQARARANDGATVAYLRHCISGAEMQRDELGYLPASLNGRQCNDSSADALSTSAQPEPSAVVSGTSKITLLPDQSVSVTAQSVSGARFTFDGGTLTVQH